MFPTDMGKRLKKILEAMRNGSKHVDRYIRKGKQKDAKRRYKDWKKNVARQAELGDPVYIEEIEEMDSDGEGKEVKWGPNVAGYDDVSKRVITERQLMDMLVEEDALKEKTHNRFYRLLAFVLLAGAFCIGAYYIHRRYKENIKAHGKATKIKKVSRRFKESHKKIPDWIIKKMELTSSDVEDIEKWGILRCKGTPYYTYVCVDDFSEGAIKKAIAEAISSNEEFLENQRKRKLKGKDRESGHSRDGKNESSSSSSDSDSESESSDEVEAKGKAKSKTKSSKSTKRGNRHPKGVANSSGDKTLDSEEEKETFADMIDSRFAINPDQAPKWVPMDGVYWADDYGEGKSTPLFGDKAVADPKKIKRAPRPPGEPGKGVSKLAVRKRARREAAEAEKKKNEAESRVPSSQSLPAVIEEKKHLRVEIETKKGVWEAHGNAFACGSHIYTAYHVVEGYAIRFFYKPQAQYYYPQ